MVLGLAHGVSDGVSGLLLGLLPARMLQVQVGALVMLYKVLAFACQPLCGFVSTRTRRPRLFALAGLALVALAMLTMPAQPVIAVTLAGCGSPACFMSVAVHWP